MTQRFNLYPAAGAPVLRATVRGRGGMASTDTLRAAVSLFRKHGRQGAACEGAPGCLLAFPDFCAEGDGEPVLVPLDGLRWRAAR
jgi:hypothetical protein